MVVKREHLIAVAFVLVLAVSYFAQKEQNALALKHARENVITLCEKSVARDAFAANGLIQVAERVEARGQSGDKLSAEKYRAAALAIAIALPHPEGLQDHQKLIEVDTITGPDGKVRFSLTEQAKKLQAIGCREAAERAT